MSNPVNRVAPSPYLDRPRLPASSSVVPGSRAARVALAVLHQAPPGSELDWLSALCRGMVRDFGRVWNLNGRSAAICQIEWSGS